MKLKKQVRNEKIMPQTEILQKIFFLKENIFRVASPEKRAGDRSHAKEFPLQLPLFFGLIPASPLENPGPAWYAIKS